MSSQQNSSTNNDCRQTLNLELTNTTLPSAVVDTSMLLANTAALTYGHLAAPMSPNNSVTNGGKRTTDFGRMVANAASLPVPPALLRATHTVNGQSSTAGTHNRHRDTANKLKVALCVNATSDEALSKPSPSTSSAVTCMATLADGRHVQYVGESHNGSAGRPPIAPKTFIYDNVWPAHTDNSEICASVLLDPIQTVVNGGDACVLCFGQGSSGRQCTTIGSDAAVARMGLMPTAVAWLYRLIGEMRSRRSDCRFSIRVSALEVVGHSERLVDLLAQLTQAGAGFDADGNEITPHSMHIDDDVVHGPQIHNQNELRANTVDKALGYLDTALASRTPESSDERRNSHMFVTLHIYQYVLESSNASVSGGRCRLHLIDLGAGDRSTAGAASSALSFATIANVLTTVLQGQKHMPNSTSHLTQLLRHSLGTSLCRSVSLVAFALTDVPKSHDTVNTLQAAAKLMRLKSGGAGAKARGIKMGTSSTGSCGNSSADEGARGTTRRRNASDPEMTSDMSSAADTVIFLGTRDQLKAHRAVAGVRIDSNPAHMSSRHSAHSASSSGRRSNTAAQQRLQQPRLGKSASPAHTSRSAGGSSEATWIDGPAARDGKSRRLSQLSAGAAYTTSSLPRAHHSSSRSTGIPSQPQWVDGPQALTSTHVYSALTTAAPSTTSHKRPPLDAYKRSMIEQWVTVVSSPENAPHLHTHLPAITQVLTPAHRLTAAQSPPSDDGDDIVLVVSPPELPAPSTRMSGSMMTSSDEVTSPQQLVPQMVDCDTQVDESEFIVDDVVYGNRLEDIRECDEDALSTKSKLTQHSCETSSDPQQQLSMANVHMLGGGTAPVTDVDMMSAAATDSCGSGHQDDNVHASNMSDEQLEEAMAASMSSLRSHDILAKMRDEQREHEERSVARQRDEVDLMNFQLQWHSQHVVTTAVHAAPATDDGSNNTVTTGSRSSTPMAPLASVTATLSTTLSASRIAKPGGMRSALPQLCSPKQLIANSCCSKPATTSISSTSHNTYAINNDDDITNNKAHNDASGVTTRTPSKLHQPRIPPLSPSITQTIHATLIQGKAMARRHSNDPPMSASARAVEEGAAALPKPGGWRRTLLQSHSARAAAKATTLTRPFTAVKPSRSKSDPKVKSPAAHAPSGAAERTTTSKATSTGTPSKCAVNKRASSGYDSGHDTSSIPEQQQHSLLPTASPYNKVTMPKKVDRTSSGNGSDGSSDVCKGVKSRLSHFLSPHKTLKPIAHNRESYSASSGYESTGANTTHSLSDTDGTTVGRGVPAKPRTWSLRNAFGVNRSRSAPQSPSVTVSRLPTLASPTAVTQTTPAATTNTTSNMPAESSAPSSTHVVRRLCARQTALKQELLEAKRRLLGDKPDVQWQYECHALKCMSPTDVGLVEVLHKEVTILEKRIVACRNHVMLVTNM